MRKISLFLFSLLLFFGALEAFSWIALKFRPVAQEKDLKIHSWEVVSPGDRNKNPGVSDLFAPPGSITRHLINPPAGDKTDVTYRIDEYGIRHTTRVPGKKKSHLFISGCSYTFGFGVKEEETATSKLAHLYPEMNVRNLAFPGGGLHTSLRFLEVVDPRQFAPEEKGTYVYVIIPAHLDRWVQDWSYFRFTNDNAPVYEEKNGHLVYAGKLMDQPRAKLIHEMKKSSAGKKTLEYLLTKFPEVSREKTEQFLRGVIELRKRYLTLYPRGRFVMVLHPMLYSHDVALLLKEGAYKKGIEFFDAYPDFLAQFSGRMSDYEVNGDGHPSEKFYEFLAGWLSEKIIKTDG